MKFNKGMKEIMMHIFSENLDKFKRSFSSIVKKCPNIERTIPKKIM
jgi:hypothetical protein